MSIRLLRAALIGVVVGSGALVGLGPSPGVAEAAPTCHVAAADAKPTEVGRIPGWAESMVVDKRGRMFVTNLTNGRLYRIDRPGAAARPITGDVDATGNVAVAPDGSLLVGTENDVLTPGRARLLRVDPDSGAVAVVSTAMRGINGIAVAPDGSIFTSSFPFSHIDKREPTGKVVRDWTPMISGNGLSVSADGRYLYIARTLPGDAIVYRVSIDDPRDIKPWATGDLIDRTSFPDGMAADSDGTIVVPSHLGQIWRITPGANDRGGVCTIADHMFGSTSLTYGHGTEGFSRGHLYRAGVDGRIVEIPAGFDPGGR